MKNSKLIWLAVLGTTIISMSANAGQGEDPRGLGCLAGIGAGGIAGMALREKPGAVDPMIKAAGLMAGGCALGAAAGAVISPASAEEAPSQEELQNDQQSQIDQE